MIDTYLKSLSLAGYRSYDNNLAQNQIDLGDINIIIGANGAGKSNLISFLEMISFMMTRGLRGYVAKQGGAQSLFYFGTKQTEEIAGELQIHDANGKKKTSILFGWSQVQRISYILPKSRSGIRVRDILSPMKEIQKRLTF